MLVLGTGELCGAWPDLEGFVRFHCLDASAGTWLDLTQRAFDAALGPSTSAPVALAYHRYRDATGAPIAGDDSRGAVYLVFTEPAPGTAAPPDNPNLFISEWLSAEHGAREQLHFRWRGTLDSQWTHIAEGSAIALYEDDQLSALKALLPMRDTNGGQHLELFPLADGVFTAKLSGGNDFEVMERGICSVLRGDTVCGDASTGAY
jgi:hypothetical protein